MIQALVLTSWVQTIGENGRLCNRPKLDVDYGAEAKHPLVLLLRCRDVTTQPAQNIPPSPNVVTVLARVATQAEFDIIETDPTAFILFAEEVPDDTQIA